MNKKINEIFKNIAYHRVLSENFNPNNLEFKYENVGYHSGQSDNIIKAYYNGKLVGSLEYSIYESSPYINMVKVNKEYRGNNVAPMLIMQLVKNHNYSDIEWGMLTSDGAKLQNKMDAYYNFDRKNTIKSSKHYDKKIIKKIGNKHPFVANFLTFMYKNAYSVAWDKYLNDIIKHRNLLGYYEKVPTIDFNDISDISKWIEGSKTNDNNKDEEPPLHVKETLEKLLS